MPCPAKDLDETMPSARVCEEEEPKETLVVFCWHGGNPLLACSGTACRAPTGRLRTPYICENPARWEFDPENNTA